MRTAAFVAGAFVVLVGVADHADARSRHHHAQRPHKHATAHAKPQSRLPLQFPGAQYEPVRWTEISGWAGDDQAASLQAFRASCKAVRPNNVQAEGKALGHSLYGACQALANIKPEGIEAARKFFEAHFVPVKISRLGESEGFVTGYYEPIIDGSREKSDEFSVPVYRKPANLFVRGVASGAMSYPNKGQVFRKVGRRKLVPYYDRAEIEDGAIGGRHLEICWVRSETDLLFMQIQGSARIRLQDGAILRINYHAHNGYPYFPVGRELIDRAIIAKEEMSMQKIREWMDANPDLAKDVRRKNRSYVFFREVPLKATDEPFGAQGVPLTPGRSIAVDKSLHVYGTPFFIAADLPLKSDGAGQSFQRLMIAQDTGSAIIGPARADIYFGAGEEAGRLSGRLRHNASFVMLIPKSLDPLAAGETMPLPRARPAANAASSKAAAQQPSKPAAAKSDAAKPAPATRAAAACASRAREAHDRAGRKQGCG